MNKREVWAALLNQDKNIPQYQAEQSFSLLHST